MRYDGRDTAAMDDVTALTQANLQFIEAFPVGSWALLEPLLSPSSRITRHRTKLLDHAL
jgi:hypothetical protein